jgi:cell division protein FtsB
MNAGTSIWDKLTRVVIVLFVIAILLGIGIWYLPLIRQNERMRQEVLRLDEQIQKEDETRKQTSTAIDAMHNDPQTVERTAREKLGYAKPGETVVRFDPPVTNTPGNP